MRVRIFVSRTRAYIILILKYWFVSVCVDGFFL